MHKTIDGFPIEIGSRVFTYDWHMGTVLDTERNRRELAKPHSAHPVSGGCDCWVDVLNDNDGQGSTSGWTNMYDCSRLWGRDQREGR